MQVLSAFEEMKAGANGVCKEILEGCCLTEPARVAQEARVRGANDAEGRLRDRMLFHGSRLGTVFMLNEPG